MIIYLVISLVVLTAGLTAIISAAKGSPRYRYFLSALGVAVALCFLTVWLQQELGNFAVNRMRGLTGLMDPTQESTELAGYYLHRAGFVFLGGLGMVLGALSLLLRKGSYSRP